jgi:FtsP/CotA-like multicopper oxidase with cupredoxin domain
MDRRGFLAGAAALSLSPRVCLSGERPTRLRLAAGRQSLVGAAHPATEVWAYNGTVPGPALRYV